MDPKDTDAVLGLFAPSHVPWDITRDPKVTPSLAEMTTKAIEILQEQSRAKDKGFFLFVEGGRIDHGHHEGRAKKALTECVAFEKAVEEALKMTSEEDTLVLVTADHSHTFALAGYPDRTANIYDTLESVADDGANYTSLLYANGPGHRDRGNLTFSNEEANQFEYRQDAGVPLKDETHGGEDVALFAKGPHSYLFAGVLEQSTIPHIIAYAACVEGFGSEELLLNATHCASSVPRPEGFNLATLAVIVPAAIIVVIAAMAAVFLHMKKVRRKRQVENAKDIQMESRDA